VQGTGGNHMTLTKKQLEKHLENLVEYEANYSSIHNLNKEFSKLLGYEIKFTKMTEGQRFIGKLDKHVNYTAFTSYWVQVKDIESADYITNKFMVVLECTIDHEGRYEILKTKLDTTENMPDYYLLIKTIGQ